MRSQTSCPSRSPRSSISSARRAATSSASVLCSRISRLAARQMSRSGIIQLHPSRKPQCPLSEPIPRLPIGPSLDPKNTIPGQFQAATLGSPLGVTPACYPPFGSPYRSPHPLSIDGSHNAGGISEGAIVSDLRYGYIQEVHVRFLRRATAALTV